MTDPAHMGSICGGRYRLAEPIARGGQAVVFRALGPDGAEVAVKLMPRPGSREDLTVGQARFRQEVKANLALHGQHVCRLLDSDEQAQPFESSYPTGVFVMVFEYIRGGNLRTYLDRLGGRLAPGESLELAKAAIEGLAEAHQLKPPLVHRDIKPENILLPDGKVGAAKIADFGISHLLGATRHTSTGVGHGTLRYMAPEQFRSTGHLSTKVDQYALALVLWECLSGEVPFLDKDLMRTWVMRDAGDPVPRLLIDGLRREALETVFGRALAPVPKMRFPSLGAFLKAFNSAGVDDELWGGRSTRGSTPLGWYIYEDNRAVGGALWLIAPKATRARLAAVLGEGVRWMPAGAAKENHGGAQWWTRDAIPNELLARVRKPASARATPSRTTGARASAGSAMSGRAERRSRPRAQFMRPMEISPALAHVIGAGPMPRIEVTKKLWAYIKRKGLQDSKQRRNINADTALQAVFGGRRKVNMFEMIKLVDRHLR